MNAFPQSFYETLSFRDLRKLFSFETALKVWLRFQLRRHNALVSAWFTERRARTRRQRELARWAPLTLEDLTLLERQDPLTLAAWGEILNFWGWPPEIPNPEEDRYIENGRRSRLVSWITERITWKGTLRWGNRNRMNYEEFEDFWRGMHASGGDPEAKARDDARMQAWVERTRRTERDFPDCFVGPGWVCMRLDRDEVVSPYDVVIEKEKGYLPCPHAEPCPEGFRFPSMLTVQDRRGEEVAFACGGCLMDRLTAIGRPKTPGC